MKRILITGTYRSGSTWQYNVVRLLCEIHAPEKVYACFHDQYDEEEAEGAEYEIVKIHRYRTQEAEELEPYTAITTIRDWRGIRGSMRRLEARGETGNWTHDDRLTDFLHDALHWAVRSTYATYYENLVDEPGAEIRRIAEHLGLYREGIEQDVLRQLVRLRDPKEGIDPLTQLHAQHKTT